MPKAKSDVTILREHLRQRHVELYGFDYVSNNHAMEGRSLKTMVAQHGVETVRAFIDACFAEYKPTPQYPGLNFGFMFAFMRERVLPRVLADMARKERQMQAEEQAQVSAENLEEWW